LEKFVRELTDGTLVYRESHDIPQVKKGYYRDKGNAWILHPDKIQCNHIIEKVRRGPCGATLSYFFCDLKTPMDMVNFRSCKHCNKKEVLNETN